MIISEIHFLVHHYLLKFPEVSEEVKGHSALSGGMRGRAGGGL